MNKVKKLSLIIIAILLAVAALFIALHGTRKATFDQDYHIADIDAVTRIFLADKQQHQVLLTRTDSATWLVDNLYPANQPLVDMLLETLHTMRIRQQVNRNAIPTIINDLSAHAIKVEIYQHVYRINWFGGRVRLFPHEKLTVTYFVGRETQDMMASYMFREGDDKPYIIHIPGFRGFLTPRFVTDPLKWRSRTIVDLDVHQIQRVALQIPDNPNENFAILRNGDGFSFQLADGSIAPHFDTARVAQMLSSFSYLNFDEFASLVPNAFMSDTADINFQLSTLTTPRTILTITDTAGHTRELKTYIKYNNPDDLAAIGDSSLYQTFDVNRLYAILDNRDTVLIQYYTFDNILQPASYFLGK